MNTEVTDDPFNEPFGDYFLHNTDNPTSGAVTPILDGTITHGLGVFYCLLT